MREHPSHAETRHAANPPIAGLSNLTWQSLYAVRLLRPKLAVGGADDPEERHADRMADAALAGKPTGCSCAPGESPCPTCNAGAVGIIRRKPRGHDVGAQNISGLSLGHEKRLTPSERGFFETQYHADLSNVRIYDNQQAAATAAQLKARAFSLGSNIAFGAGEYQPDTRKGQHLLAHELAHVILGHTDIRRMSEIAAEGAYERQEKRRLAQEAAERRHQAWEAGVNRQFSHDLTGQSHTIGEERERLDLAMTAQRAAAIDEAIAGKGWLADALHNRDYSGPGLKELKESWGTALVAAELLQLNAAQGTTTTDAQLSGLEAIPAFYVALRAFSAAAEDAHTAHVAALNKQAHAEYEARVAEWEQNKKLDKMSEGPIGEPGEHAARATQALVRGPRPEPPVELTGPPKISNEVDAANARVYAADSLSQWQAVVSDVNRLGNGFVTLVAASLPEKSEARTGLEYLEQLDARLAQFERPHAVMARIPAVFYPNDRTISRKGENGKEDLAPESIPWQFYLINTGVPSYDQPARSGGEWVLTDLTSSQRFENRAAASDFDSARMQQGEAVDPPINMFSELNSRIRFPEGKLYLTLPSGKSYMLETTEPWSLSDWLTAIGVALAAIALVASVIATGGASAPAAVAFYAGLGAAVAGVGSTLANLHEREQQGILTSEDVDKAMISIGIDIVTAMSMGLGRLVTAPAAAAKLGLIGERFIVLQKVTQVVRAGAIAGDVYQAWSFTSEFIRGFEAIRNQRGLTDEERDRMRGQLIRRALLTGILLTIAIRGDVKDYRAGRALRISHVDSDGALVVHASEPGAHADEPNLHEHADASGTSTARHVAPHAEVSSAVHANAPGAGSTLTVGTQSHALAPAGTGRNRDFYFCSDLCAPIVQRLSTIIDVLPRNHPERKIFQDLLSRARGASQRLKTGKLTQEEADIIAAQISTDIGRHSDQSELFGALMNTDPSALVAHGTEVRQRLASTLDVRSTNLSSQGERQKANRGLSRGHDPLVEPDPRSPIELDVLGGFNIQDVARPGKKLQPLHFDAGNFAHSNAEALVPGLPRGLTKEAPVTLPDGSVGRADRVRFIYDADGNRIGAHVYEVKPDTPDNIARGQVQAEEYVAGLRAEIEQDLRAAKKAIPTVAPDGGPLYRGQVLTYNFEQMMAVLRALRASRADAAQMAELEALARRVFANAR